MFLSVVATLRCRVIVSGFGRRVSLGWHVSCVASCDSATLSPRGDVVSLCRVIGLVMLCRLSCPDVACYAATGATVECRWSLTRIVPRTMNDVATTGTPGVSDICCVIVSSYIVTPLVDPRSSIAQVSLAASRHSRACVFESVRVGSGIGRGVASGVATGFRQTTTTSDSRGM